MPFKSNASRRDKFAKAKYRVKNQAEYNEALGLTFYPRCPVRCAVSAVMVRDRAPQTALPTCLRRHGSFLGGVSQAVISRA